MITFTIITCTYNAEEVLKRTLDSVFEQTHPHVEHIIVDGASADGTLKMALEYQENNDALDTEHSVEVISERDKGLYDAMNKGIEKATGNYILFLNAGDVFPSAETLEHVAVGFADGEPLPGVLYGQADIVNDRGDFIRHRRLEAPQRLSWRSFRQGMLVCHQAFYARTDVAKQVRYDLSYRYSADVDWCIRIMKRCEQEHLTLKYVGEVLVDYLDGGMSVQHHQASLKERFRIMVKHYGYVQTLFMHFWFVVRAGIKK